MRLLQHRVHTLCYDIRAHEEQFAIAHDNFLPISDFTRVAMGPRVSGLVKSPSQTLGPRPRPTPMSHPHPQHEEVSKSGHCCTRTAAYLQQKCKAVIAFSPKRRHCRSGGPASGLAGSQGLKRE